MTHAASTTSLHPVISPEHHHHRLFHPPGTTRSAYSWLQQNQLSCVTKACCMDATPHSTLEDIPYSNRCSAPHSETETDTEPNQHNRIHRTATRTTPPHYTPCLDTPCVRDGIHLDVLNPHSDCWHMHRYRKTTLSLHRPVPNARSPLHATG